MQLVDFNPVCDLRRHIKDAKNARVRQIRLFVSVRWAYTLGFRTLTGPTGIRSGPRSRIKEKKDQSDPAQYSYYVIHRVGVSRLKIRGTLTATVLEMAYLAPCEGW